MLQRLVLAGLALAAAQWAAADRIVDYVAPSLIGETNNVRARATSTNITATSVPALAKITSGAFSEKSSFKIK